MAGAGGKAQQGRQIGDDVRLDFVLPARSGTEIASRTSAAIERATVPDKGHRLRA